MDYNMIIKKLLNDYNNTFGTSFKIIFDTEENILKIEPTLILRKTTVGVYHNKSKNIFMNKDTLLKLEKKNIIIQNVTHIFLINH